MIFQCNECWKRFDADTEPAACPYCGSAGHFAQITITVEPPLPNAFALWKGIPGTMIQ